MVEEETSETMNTLVSMSTKPKPRSESENLIMPEGEGPECSTGGEHITPMEDGEIG